MVRPVWALVAAILLVLAAVHAMALGGGDYLDSGVPAYRGYDPLAQLPRDKQPDGPVKITLTEDWVVENTQGIVTLSPQMAHYSPAETAANLGFPGITQDVVIDTNGYRIIVKAGGQFVLQKFDDDSRRLLVTGNGILFSVEDGGFLRLDRVEVKTSGPAIQLSETSVYSWNGFGSDYPAPETVGGAELLVAKPAFGENILKFYDGILWRDGLPMEKFPTLRVVCSVGGNLEERPRDLPVVWDVESRKEDIERRRDCTLEGWFPDEDGGRLPASFTPELSVKFLKKAPVQIKKTEFGRSGSGDYYCIFFFDAPDESDSVWAEVSEDQGKSWKRCRDTAVDLGTQWQQLSYVADNTPRLYRVVVEGGPNAGISDPVEIPALVGQLPHQPDEDIGGTRGGGTALTRPRRDTASPDASGAGGAQLSTKEENSPDPARLTEQVSRASSERGDMPPETGETQVPGTGESFAAGSPGAGKTGRDAGGPPSSTERLTREERLAIAEKVERDVPAMAENTDAITAPSIPGQAMAVAAGITVCCGIGIAAGNPSIIRKQLAWIKKLLAERRIR